MIWFFLVSLVVHGHIYQQKTLEFNSQYLCEITQNIVDIELSKIEETMPKHSVFIVGSCAKKSVN